METNTEGEIVGGRRDTEKNDYIKVVLEAIAFTKSAWSTPPTMEHQTIDPATATNYRTTLAAYAGASK